MNKPASAETQIPAGGAVDDALLDRIDWLVHDYFVKLADSQGGWRSLYRDPTDHRLWEKSYPNSEFHGGGTPVLTVVSVDEAAARYGLLREDG